jgi:hypothetical protein
VGARPRFTVPIYGSVTVTAQSHGWCGGDGWRAWRAWRACVRACMRQRRAPAAAAPCRKLAHLGSCAASYRARGSTASPSPRIRGLFLKKKIPRGGTRRRRRLGPAARTPAPPPPPPPPWAAPPAPGTVRAAAAPCTCLCGSLPLAVPSAADCPALTASPYSPALALVLPLAARCPRRLPRRMPMAFSTKKLRCVFSLCLVACLVCGGAIGSVSGCNSQGGGEGAGEGKGKLQVVVVGD